jgi:hypothetical protein
MVHTRQSPSDTVAVWGWHRAAESPDQDKLRCRDHEANQTPPGPARTKWQMSA